jgi:pimeloyl-ACP methyl ester carboxylesterase/catechol 2,3-dioxygenase-like lactoylglutathione lyase family enzyme
MAPSALSQMDRFGCLFLRGHKKHYCKGQTRMKFVSTRIVTDNVTTLARFYKDVTGIAPVGSECYVEIAGVGGVLAICSKESVDIFNAGAARPKANDSLILEFEVDHVDQERARLDEIIDGFVLEPTDQPWGNRSLMFRDPDGNLINFFEPVDRGAAWGAPKGGGCYRRMAPLARPAWLTENVWPFTTQSLDLDGTRVAVTDVGRGPVLLFVHTGMWSFIWRDVMLRLSADFRCLCFDAPGTGQSERLARADINLERASRATAAVIEHLNLENITLVVHDLGGPAGIAGAARVPGRVSGLCAVMAFAWRPTGTFFRGMLALMGSGVIREFDAMSGALARITATSFGVGLHLNPASRRAFFAGIGSDGLRAFHSYMGDARNCEDLYEEVDRALAGAFRELPLLTIFGERNDPLGFQPQWKRLFPGAQQVVIPKGNHFPMCDDPDLVAGTIRSWHRECVATLRSDEPLHPKQKDQPE